MGKAKQDEEFSDEEAERRTTEALRRALTTPYKPQREMVGKTSRPASRKNSSRPIKKPK